MPSGQTKSRELAAPGGRSLNANPTPHEWIHPAVFARHPGEFCGRSFAGKEAVKMREAGQHHEGWPQFKRIVRAN